MKRQATPAGVAFFFGSAGQRHHQPMITMKKILLVLTVAATFAGLPSLTMAAPATDPQTATAVKAVLDAMEVRKTMTASLAGMEKQLPAMMRSQMETRIKGDRAMSAEKKQEALAKVDRTLPIVMQGVHRLFGDPALVDEMVAELVPLYARHYTVAELQELAAFYRTPLGRKVMATAPTLTSESMAAGQRVVTHRLGKLIQDIMQDIQKQ